jgi:hypothetical protein
MFRSLVWRLAAICWVIWKLINGASFDKKMINSHVDLILYECVFIKYWAGLHSITEQEMLCAGADILQRNALGDVAAVHQVPPRLLGDAARDDNDMGDGGDQTRNGSNG